MGTLLKSAAAFTRLTRSARFNKLGFTAYRSLNTAWNAVAVTQGSLHVPKPVLKTESRVVLPLARLHSSPVNECVKPEKSFVSDNLPRLPVPKLHDTLGRYLKTVQPHVTPEEFAATERAVLDFGAPGGIGEKLQMLLEAKAERTDNWLSEWWLNLAYLQLRLPLPVWSSPGILLPIQKADTPEDQLNLASKVISGIVDFKEMIDDRKVPQEMAGKNPLDMSQYYNIFYTCRIPGRTIDKLVHYGDSDKIPTHMIVMRNNHFFCLEVFGRRGDKKLTEAQILEQLRKIVAESENPGVPLGICTTDNRANWGAAYDALRQAKGNKTWLEAINSAICLICLDGPNPNMSKHAPDDRTVAALEMIHGCGTSGNAGNRWFDKTIQFIIGSKGQIGMAYEHSPAEGPPIAQLTDHVMDFVTGKKKSEASAAEDVRSPTKLEFNIPPAVHDAIATAEQNLDGLVSDIEMTMHTFKGFGKSFIKQFKMSPDSFIQMAIQLAFYRIHGEPAATYESASTRKYLHGRTECIRSCSNESLAFCEAMMNRNATISEKARLLKLAVEGHKRYVIDACDGYGVDRHLLGLKQIAIENGMNLHEMYLDPGYTRSSHMRLSTSQVPAKYDTVMCFGPLVPDGYGCCYNPRTDSINFGLSACFTSPETHSGKFSQALEESLLDMQDTLSASAAKL